MEKLNYATLEQMNFGEYLLKEAPEKVLQFGEGNFLRAFVDYFFDLMNEKAGFNGKVCVTQPIAQGLAGMINEQEGLYTLFLRGSENGEKVNKKRVISSISRCLNPYEDFESLMKMAEKEELRFIVSNTTEAGIAFDPSCKKDDAPPASFPGKLTAFLYRRFSNKLPGFIILSCELIDHNGDELKKCVHRYIDLWKLGDGFAKWVDEQNIFCSTLVDRIVPGYPRNEAEAICKELGYQDNLIDTGEVFGFWVIEGPQSIKDELPFEKAGLPIIVVDDVTPYKQRKVRILNGAHTSFIMAAYLSGQDIVRDCMKDEVIHGFMNKTLYDEVIPTLDLPKDDLMQFAADVTERFANPFVDHQLLSISLNSASKWKARCMPSLLEYAKRNGGALAPCLTFSFAAFLTFYHNGKEKGEACLIAKRGEDTYQIKDDDWVLDFFYDHKDDEPAVLAKAVIDNEKMWDDSLKSLSGFTEEVIRYLGLISEKGMYEAMRTVIQ
ncbi:MAG: tagaturonate reductase [Lachnospiraceae bacterium]|nr:tagaturonate reductase [Lachnospiraceae bacterium]